jgi:hypothetical protein
MMWRSAPLARRREIPTYKLLFQLRARILQESTRREPRRAGLLNKDENQEAILVPVLTFLWWFVTRHGMYLILEALDV